jgi:hypothetical protein
VLALICAGLLIQVSISTPANAAPWIERLLQPAIPDHLEIGDTFSAWAQAHPDGTTPDRVVIRIVSPDGVVVHEQQAEAGSPRLEIEWTVPADATPGIYLVNLEYWSIEHGLTVFAQEATMLRIPNGICVFKFNDENQDGMFDAETEELLSGWEICLGDDCRVTDSQGVICWLGLPAGEYQFCETPQEGWSCTTCTEGDCMTIVLEDPTSVGKVMFGNTMGGLPTERTPWGRVKSIFR